MHATIQKPIEEIMNFIKPGEKVFVVGCNNCAWKCHSGGEDETKGMAERLIKRGVEVVGYSTPGPRGMSLCKLEHTRKVLKEDYAAQIQQADSFLVLGCGQGVHTVIDATEGAMIHPGCDTIFGGETVSETDINEYCSLCGECIIEFTGGLCPMTLCAKSLLNGPCGGAENGKCEVDPDRDCGWVLIYERLKMRKKADAGAEFFQTQAVYDDRCVDAFVAKAAGFGRPVQLGVVVLKSPQMGAYMNKNISGISVPQAWIEQIGAVAKGDRKKKAAEMTGRFIKKHKAKFQGVHIMPLGWTDIVPDILAHAEIAAPQPAAG